MAPARLVSRPLNLRGLRAGGHIAPTRRWRKGFSAERHGLHLGHQDGAILSREDWTHENLAIHPASGGSGSRLPGCVDASGAFSAARSRDARSRARFPPGPRRRPRPQVSLAARNPCAPHRRWTLPLRPPQAPRRPGVIFLPPAASLRPQPRLREATRRPRSNSPTPALKARRPRLGRRRRSRRPRRRPLGNRPRRLLRRRSLRLTPPCRRREVLRP